MNYLRKGPETVLRQALALQDHLTEIRRIIHRHPELGFREFKTARFVAETLTSLGIGVRTGVGGTGVVGHLEGSGPIIALRADMDALPIQERNDVPYASEVPGVMHACGHDAHVACLLGAAMLLAGDPPPTGRVRFLFQPSEEGQGADGKSGAMRMIEDGAMDGVAAVVGLHVFSDIPAGIVGVRTGPMMAAADSFTVAILGQACHGAYPHKGIDAVLLSAHVITAIQQIVARRVSPIDSGVITVGKIQGGTKRNIVADRVEMQGTIRSFDPQVRQQLFDELERACSLAHTLGGNYQLHIMPGYPVSSNDAELTDLVRQVAADLLGADQVVTASQVMGAEDFSFLAAEATGCFFRLGVGFPGQPPRAAHNPNFDIDESALPIGAAMLAETARRFLAE